MRNSIFATCLVVVGSFAGCQQAPSSPTGPSSTDARRFQIAAMSLDWQCFTNFAAVSSSGSWSIVQQPAACPASLVTAPLGPAIADTAPPSNLRVSVNGTTVRLDWDYSDTRDGFVIEAGSALGLTNLASLTLPSGPQGPTGLTVNNVPSGTYYVRVRAYDSMGRGPASADVVVRVGCNGAPGAPSGLTSDVRDFTVTLTWNAPMTGDSATSYVIEAGTTSGLSNAAVLETSGRTLSAVAPGGRYFARVRGKSACGLSPASNEVVLDVPSGSPPAACPSAISPASLSVPVAGGTFDLSVTAPALCSWQASSTVPWVTLGSPSSGSGSGTIRYSVSANGSSARSGEVRVTGNSGETRAQQVAQQGFTQCTYSVSPSTHNVPSGGGSIVVSVSTQSGCSWTAVSQNSFISLVSGGSGNGSGAATFAVDNNSSVARAGTVRVVWNGGTTDVSVSQASGVAAAPVANFVVDQSPCPLASKDPSNPLANPLLKCTFDARPSTGAITSWEWQLGTYAWTGQVTTDIEIGCGFASSVVAPREVTLTVRDGLGRTHSVTKTILFRRDSGC